MVIVVPINAATAERISMKFEKYRDRYMTDRVQKLAAYKSEQTHIEGLEWIYFIIQRVLQQPPTP